LLGVSFTAFPVTIKVKIPTGRSADQGRKGKARRRDPLVRLALLGFLGVSLVVMAVFAYWYV